MSSSNPIRLGGLAAIVGGVALVVLWLWMKVAWLESPLAAPAMNLLVVGAMAAIVALHALQSQHYGLAGTKASLAAFVGLAMYLLGEGVAYARGDFFLAFPATIFLGVVGLLGAIVGLLVLGVVTSNAGVLPWWCGVALIAGNPMVGFYLYFFYYGLLMSLFGVAWAIVGYAIFRAAGRRTERPPRVR
jgi:uncharacterized membrane protein HdeD (DUF308 family)